MGKSRRTIHELSENKGMVGTWNWLLLFSCEAMSNSATPWPAAYQASCPSISKLSPRVHSNSCTLNQCFCLTISSSAALFSFCLQSFMASKSFPMSQLFASGGQSIGDSASASICPVIIQHWFPFGLTDLISWNWCNSLLVPVWTFPVVAIVNSCD